MKYFTSDHLVPGRIYRVADHSDARRLTRVEYLRGGTWRESLNYNSREIGHCVVHGAPHPGLPPVAANDVRKAASAATILNGKVKS